MVTSNKMADTRVLDIGLSIQWHLLSKHGRYDRFQSYPDGLFPYPIERILGKGLGDSNSSIFNRLVEKSQESQATRNPGWESSQFPSICLDIV